ncbi:hypothetical protein NIES4071_63960 [Calothrix sp. NIES-4071]|nr:hypothetical protein NIES4071_63960 [Calothrix sp. NIES-4071]BAZ60700.1 hypothetical protein NIES4105_63920 [Calothrix sp. NIES-4105]
MTSSESNNSDVFEVDGFHLVIGEPNLIVLPIPDNRSDSNTSVEINVYFINNTPNSFRLSPDETLILELLASDGEALQAQLTPGDADIQLNTTPVESWGLKLRRLISNLTRFPKQNETSKVDTRLIEPGGGINIPLAIKLLWFDNKLQLQIRNNSSYLQVVFRINKCWSFDNLRQGAYQFRFVWGSPSNGEFALEPQTRGGIRAAQLVTQFVNLSLIESVGNDDNAVEVEGIRFETLLPERTLILPEKKRGIDTRLQIGILITNNTRIPVRFSFFSTLIPQLIEANGQQLKRWYSRTGTKRPLLSDFPFVMPGECITLFPYASIFWQKGEVFTLSIDAGDGGFWNFEVSKVSNYQIQFIYKNKSITQKIYDRENMNMSLIEGLWIGMVYTPKIKFYLIQY